MTIMVPKDEFRHNVLVHSVGRRTNHIHLVDLDRLAILLPCVASAGPTYLHPRATTGPTPSQG